MERVVSLPAPNTKSDWWVSSVYNVTASEVRDVLTSSHLHCTWETSRGGEIEPCGKEAVAIRYDENNGTVSEVCKHHAVRVLVPLWFIAQVAAHTALKDGAA